MRLHDDFCERSEQIDLHELITHSDAIAYKTMIDSLATFNHTNYGYDIRIDHVLNLGPLGSYTEGSQCRACNFFTSVRRRCIIHPEPTGYSLYVYRNSFPRTSADVESTPPSERTYWSRLCFAVLCDDCPRGYSDGDPGRTEGQIVIDAQAESHGDLLASRTIRIEPASVDYSIVHEWIARCEEEHHGLCHSRTGKRLFPTNLKLIDCDSHEVVQASTGCKYAALSYVWGTPTPQKAQASTAGMLSEPLPQTIKDALEATRRLGIRFIWIDRYCIDHSDEGTKQAQIRQMDLIYQQAYITLVAAAGQDPSFGLPGVGPTPRISRHELQCGQHRLVDVPRVGKPGVFASSAWSERAWTFQECFFSARLLVFTENQVYFQCRKYGFWESIPDLANLGRPDHSFPRPEEFNEPHIYHLLEAYCERKLSYDYDALNAFEGILHHLRNVEPPVKHLQGILIVPPTEALILARSNQFFHFYLEDVPKALDLGDEEARIAWFINSLGWTKSFSQKSPGFRRPMFPSWSWAGWSCSIESNRNFKIGNWTGKTLAPVISVENSDGAIVGLRELLSEHNWKKDPGKILHLDALTLPVSILGHKVSTGDIVSKSLGFIPGKYGKPSSPYLIFESQDVITYFPGNLIGVSDDDQDATAPKIDPDCELVFVMLNNYGISGMSETTGLLVQNCGGHFERVGSGVLAMHSAYSRNLDTDDPTLFSGGL